MTHHPSTHRPQAAETKKPQASLHDRVAACELLLQHLVFVLEASSSLDIEAFDRWLTIARDRMLATGSAPQSVVAALARLQALVQA
ncbi:hypothetical protein [Paracidovorax wautersii]|uniref:Uncharacterized protein n=1 Tax=Paracidovorax wautersii TaxID=1177982 RepID=A0A1I2E796_9BURK|nr:hypothetical protein [Paracidovorax wautersii]SFE88499.1 hypothetical protein SAMN04489711_106262 [Paracidovorax wautersii]